MIWDCTTFWCRIGEGHNDLGEINLCGDCLPRANIKVNKMMLLNFAHKRVHPPVHIDPEPIVRRPKAEPLGFTGPEDGSEARYDKRKAEHPWFKHTAWWFVHNCVAHVLIGILPLKLFFDFHDWTSRKMHGKNA